jgi:hypothetical protein
MGVVHDFFSDRGYASIVSEFRSVNNKVHAKWKEENRN